ncbi:hypothetical protein BGX33_003191, partial [Mortierella sp. NVP41]
RATGLWRQEWLAKGLGIQVQQHHHAQVLPCPPRLYLCYGLPPPDGCRIVTASRSGKIGVWDSSSSQL